MIVFVYSETHRGTVRERLGRSEYSYHFVREKFLPVLRRVAEVVELDDPAAGLAQRLEAARREGKATVLLFFGPPHRLPSGLALPAVCVFAWEYPTIPTETWDDNPANDWRVPLGAAGRAIALSGLGAEAVRRALGADFRVAVIPAPIAHPPGLGPWLRILARAGPVKRGVPVEVCGRFYDSRRYRIDHEFIEPLDSADGGQRANWAGQPLDWRFGSEDGTAALALVGFYNADSWGSWSRTRSPWITLPWRVDSPCTVCLDLVGIGPNAGAEIAVELGGDRRTVRLGSRLERFELDFRPAHPADALRFSGIVPAPGGFSAADPRTLGMGIAGLRLSGPGGDAAAAAPAPPEPAPAALETTTLDGVVYTSVFNPEDGRKNWEDMVTAFCWALREREDATLVLKMSHHNPATFHGRLMGLFSALHPFRCRIVAVHGFLDERQYRMLVDASSYVVNSSRCEGQCLPLMEFMRHGVPAIAPDHTAMREYVDPSNAFVVASSAIPECWPQDPRRAYRTESRRIDWDSLRQAFVAAHACALERPALRYRRMSLAAARRIARGFGEDVVARALGEFLAEAADG